MSNHAIGIWSQMGTAAYGGDDAALPRIYLSSGKPSCVLLYAAVGLFPLPRTQGAEIHSWVSTETGPFRL